MLCLAIIGISFSTTFDVMTSYRSIGIHSEKRNRERERMRESNQVYSSTFEITYDNEDENCRECSSKTYLNLYLWKILLFTLYIFINLFLISAIRNVVRKNNLSLRNDNHLFIIPNCHWNFIRKSMLYKNWL